MDPIDEIVSEREKARERGDLNANVCFLATVSEDGGGAVRAISLRDVDHRGFGLLLNGLSVKWAELESGRGFELLIYWPTVSRQYRVRGRMAPMEEEESRRFWNYKSHGSKLLEMYYPTFEPQTTVVPSREHLVAGIEELEKRYPDKDDIPLPASLKGVLRGTKTDRDLALGGGAAARPAPLHQDGRWVEGRGVGSLTGNAGQVYAVDRRKPRADTLDVVCEPLGDLVVRSISNTGDVGRGNDVVVKYGV